jgi:serine/threonine protein kinase
MALKSIASLKSLLSEVGAPDRLVLLERLGFGGQAEVWLAHDQMLERFVTVKKMRAFKGADDGPDDERLNSLRARAEMEHPSIPTLFSVIPHGDQSWLVSEYVEGVPLSELLGELSPESIFAVAKDLLSALRCLERLSLVHGDLSPNNIVIDRNGQVRLLDFESCSRIGDELSSTSTIGFSAPERHAQRVGLPTVDTWSVGAVLIWLVTQRTPEIVLDDAKRPISVVIGPAIPATDLLGDVINIAAAATRLDPSLRPLTADLEERLALSYRWLEPVNRSALEVLVSSRLDSAGETNDRPTFQPKSANANKDNLKSKLGSERSGQAGHEAPWGEEAPWEDIALGNRHQGLTGTADYENGRQEPSGSRSSKSNPGSAEQLSTKRLGTNRFGAYGLGAKWFGAEWFGAKWFGATWFGQGRVVDRVEGRVEGRVKGPVNSPTKGRYVDNAARVKKRSVKKRSVQDPWFRGQGVLSPNYLRLFLFSLGLGVMLSVLVLFLNWGQQPYSLRVDTTRLSPATALPKEFSPQWVESIFSTAMSDKWELVSKPAVFQKTSPTTEQRDGERVSNELLAPGQRGDLGGGGGPLKIAGGANTQPHTENDAMTAVILSINCAKGICELLAEHSRDGGSVLNHTVILDTSDVRIWRAAITGLAQSISSD